MERGRGKRITMGRRQDKDNRFNEKEGKATQGRDGWRGRLRRE